MTSGLARVIRSPQDLSSFRPQAILVCEAINPTITFLVPLCSVIVERRGGILIHGAIITRVYRIPCVTGIRDVTMLIRTSIRLTVDGYLRVVTIYGEDMNEPGKTGEKETNFHPVRPVKQTFF